MNTPTITYLTTLDLGYPGGGEERELVERVVSNRTLGGILRSAVLSRHYVYRLTFSGILTTAYDALVTLWATAEAAGTYPTFDFHDLWATANGVAVSLDIGPLVWDVPGSDAGSFDLVLAEVNPR